eukprot:862513-Amorphochlora_amoeboformis.AAC.1
MQRHTTPDHTISYNDIPHQTTNIPYNDIPHQTKPGYSKNHHTVLTSDRTTPHNTTSTIGTHTPSHSEPIRLHIRNPRDPNRDRGVTT